MENPESGSLASAQVKKVSTFIASINALVDVIVERILVQSTHQKPCVLLDADIMCLLATSRRQSGIQLTNHDILGQVYERVVRKVSSQVRCIGCGDLKDQSGFWITVIER